MTAPTLVGPPERPPAEPPQDQRAPSPPSAGSSRQQSTLPTLEIAATIGLAAYSFVAALGYHRVFGDWDFVRDALWIIVVGHGLSLAFRLLRLPGIVAVAVTLVALAWIVGYLHYPDTYTALLPTTTTWDVASADVALVRDQFRTAVAPVEYIGGWALLASIGAALTVFASDVFAFRANARGEALVPGGVLFVFIAALGTDIDRIPLALGLVAAGFVAAALLRARALPLPRTTLGRPRHPLTIVLPAALGAGGLVVLGAWVIGPRLPGAGEEPLVETRNRGSGVTEVLSPLVDIRSRLVNRSASELFVVSATTPAYWRAAALPEFDGRTWGLPERSLEDVEGGLQEARPGSTENRQDITIAALAGPLVPAAAEPVAASGPDLRWNAETSMLVKIDETLVTGDQFEIVSAMPVFSPDALRASSSAAPPDAIYLELPTDFPTSIAELAVTVTAGQTTAYDAALTLQNWFRTEFEYSIDIPQGHGNSALEAFLLRQRIGYCEQFAGSFAAMMRSLGIPSRVAVGFTPGLLQPDGSRSVLGRNAHAWPEVWFDGAGWVPFEPTPGRGVPGAEAHTGVGAAQDETVPTPGELAGEGPGDAIPAPLPPAEPAIPQSDLIPEEVEAADPGFTPVTVTLDGPRLALIPVLIGVVLLAALLAAPELVRRWRRRHPSSDVAREIRHLWERALGAVEATGFHVDPALTPNEQARAAAPRLPVAARPLKSLAALTTEAIYAPDDQVVQLTVPTLLGEAGPRRWARQVERIAADSMTAGGRVKRYFTVWR